MGAAVELPDRNLEQHHIFPGNPNRRHSEKYGLKVWLCINHHRMSEYAVHNDRDYMTMLKVIAQEEFEKRYSHEKFMQVFGRNWR